MEIIVQKRSPQSYDIFDERYQSTIYLEIHTKTEWIVYMSTLDCILGYCVHIEKQLNINMWSLENLCINIL